MPTVTSESRRVAVAVIAVPPKLNIDLRHLEILGFIPFRFKPRSHNGLGQLSRARCFVAQTS
jgi:hypothetical protein